MESPLTHTTFVKIIKKTAKALDYYNSNDQTRSTDTVDQNTSGEVLGICINLACHTIYDLIKTSKYLQALPSTNLKSTANQDFIELDVEPTLDEIEAITDTTNNFKLVKREWHWYRRKTPDPSKSTGIPTIYIRRKDRIYLTPRPTSVISYVVDFIKNQNDMVYDLDMPLIPTHYDYWIIAEAAFNFYQLLDPDSVPQSVIVDRAEKREIAMNAILSGFDQTLQSESHFVRRARNRIFADPYDHINAY